MTNSKLTRRDFLRDTTLYGGGALDRALSSRARTRARAAAESSQPRRADADAEWKTVEAITGRIIPTDSRAGRDRGALRELHRQGARARGRTGAPALQRWASPAPSRWRSAASDALRRSSRPPSRTRCWCARAGPRARLAGRARRVGRVLRDRARAHDHRLPRRPEVRRQSRLRRLEAGRLSRAAPSPRRLHPRSDAGPGEDQDASGERICSRRSRGSCSRPASEGASSFSTCTGSELVKPNSAASSPST